MYISEDKVNRYKDQDIIEEFHDNVNIKKETILEWRDTTRPKMSHVLKRIRDISLRSTKRSKVSANIPPIMKIHIWRI